jgi:hypothetical protein
VKESPRPTKRTLMPTSLDQVITTGAASRF